MFLKRHTFMLTGMCEDHVAEDRYGMSVTSLIAVVCVSSIPLHQSSEMGEAHGTLWYE